MLCGSQEQCGRHCNKIFLGVFEAAVTPGFALFTSQWYTKSEQGSRTGIWFGFNGFAQVKLLLCFYAPRPRFNDPLTLS